MFLPRLVYFKSNTVSKKKDETNKKLSKGLKKKKINFTGSQLLLLLSFYYAIHREKRAL